MEGWRWREDTTLLGKQRVKYFQSAHTHSLSFARLICSSNSEWSWNESSSLLCDCILLYSLRVVKGRSRWNYELAIQLLSFYFFPAFTPPPTPHLFGLIKQLWVRSQASICYDASAL